ncbi:MAG: hypothetical protein K8W52_00745 [Deltaproteobacteria bacterium]|nr:hypothetical protein [Deltaproteobacteria bacterium]
MAVLALASGVCPRLATAESPTQTPVRAVDLLIVVDTSPRAASTRAAFAAHLPGFVYRLLSVFPGDYGPALDLQVGVITANPDDHGELRSATIATCAAAPSARFAHYTSDQWAMTTTNYTGELAAAIQCLVPIDVVGPTTAQPAAMVNAALDGSVAVNEGFLRADAALAVLVVSDQDDCSGSATTPFACAQAAWTCTPPIDASPGARTSCVANSEPVGLLSIDGASALLALLKPDIQRVAVGAIRGPAAPVFVTSGPSLVPSCAFAGITATPGLRLDAILARFPNHWAASACDASYDDFTETIAAAAGVPITVGERDMSSTCDGGEGSHDDAASPERMGCGCRAGAAGAAGAGVNAAIVLALMIRRRRAR